MKSFFFFFISCILSILSSCSSPPHETHLPFVKVTSPKVESVPIYMQYPGHLEPYKTVNLQAQVTGTLVGMHFEEGKEVKEGQLLFTIDSGSYQAAVAKSEALLKGAIATYKFSEKAVSRYGKLVQDNFVSKLSYDEYLANSLATDATVQAREAEIEIAKIDLGHCTLYSPLNGIAGKKQIDVGNLITVAEKTPLVIINQVDPIYASFYVPDVDLFKIQTHQRESGPLKVEAYLDGNYEAPYVGELTLIDNAVSRSTGSVFMKATFSNPDKLLWPGEFVDVKVILSKDNNSLLLPTKAVQLGQKGYYAFVIKENNIAEMRQVKIGQRYGEYISILEGITADDQVVIQGQQNLFSGVKVKILSPEKKETSSPQAISIFNLKKGKTS